MTKKGLTGISLTACAVEIGISPPRLMSLVKEGRIPRNPDGSFDVDAVKIAFAVNRDPSQASKVAPPDSQPLTETGFAAARTAREHVKLRTEKIDLEIKESRIVFAERIRMEIGEMIVAAKGRLLGIGNKHAQRLAAASDPVIVEEIITGEITLALSELSKWTAISQQPSDNS